MPTVREYDRLYGPELEARNMLLCKLLYYILYRYQKIKKVDNIYKKKLYNMCRNTIWFVKVIGIINDVLVFFSSLLFLYFSVVISNV